MTHEITGEVDKSVPNNTVSDLPVTEKSVEHTSDKQIPTMRLEPSIKLVYPSPTLPSPKNPNLLTSQVIMRRYERILMGADLTRLNSGRELGFGGLIISRTPCIMTRGWHNNGTDKREYIVSQIAVHMHGLTLARRLSYIPYPEESFVRGELVPQETIILEGVDLSIGDPYLVKIGYTDWRRFGSDTSVKSYCYDLGNLNVPNLIEGQPIPLSKAEQLNIRAIFGIF